MKPSGLANWHLSKVPTLPQRLADRGPMFKCWLKQIVNSFGSNDFLRQALYEGLGSS